MNPPIPLKPYIRSYHGLGFASSFLTLGTLQPGLPLPAVVKLGASGNGLGLVETKGIYYIGIA